MSQMQNVVVDMERKCEVDPMAKKLVATLSVSKTGDSAKASSFDVGANSGRNERVKEGWKNVLIRRESTFEAIVCGEDFHCPPWWGNESAH